MLSIILTCTYHINMYVYIYIGVNSKRARKFMGLLFLATHLFFIVFVSFNHFWTTIPLNLKLKKKKEIKEKEVSRKRSNLKLKKKNKKEKREKGREVPGRETAIVVADVAETAARLAEVAPLSVAEPHTVAKPLSVAALLVVAQLSPSPHLWSLLTSGRCPPLAIKHISPSHTFGLRILRDYCNC